MSRKRKLPDDIKINDIDASKRIRLEQPLESMKCKDLKKEIKKRDKTKKISKLKKSDLKSILFKQIQLSVSEINKLNRKDIIRELKMHNEYKGRSSWNRNDLCDYLKYINSNQDALKYEFIENQKKKSDENTEIPKSEFIQIPLFKIHRIYCFGTKQTNRDIMYNKLLKRWQHHKDRQQKKDNLIKPIINNFLNVNNDGRILSVKTEIQDNHDPVLVFPNLDQMDRITIHQFAEKNGLYSMSSGPSNHRILGVSRACDRSLVFDILQDEVNVLNQKLNAIQNDKWNKIMEKHLFLKERIKSNQNNNDNNDDEFEWDICGEWVMNHDFGYGNEDKYYLYINKSDNNFYGSFLIGPIEGKLMLESNGKNKFLFNWRGRETGEGEIQIGDNNVGEIKFSEFGTEAIGSLQSDYGNFKFRTYRVSSNIKIKATKYDFEYDEQEEYEKARRSRWN